MKPFKKMETITKYTPKIERMEKHIEEHPSDYQTKISLAKLYGEEFNYLRKKRVDYMKSEVAKYKKETENEKHS